MQTNHHTKITPLERDRIAQWRAGGMGIREMARRLCRSPSSISDELRRNSHREAGYVAIHAQRLANERIAPARKRHPLKNATTFAYIYKKLRSGWSPEMIAGRLKKEQGRTVISHETIYQYVYAPENADRFLFEYLPWKRKKRKKKQGRGVHRSRIPHRVSIHDRPAVIETRTEFGHWEGDSVEGKGHKNGIHTEVERMARFLTAEKVARIASQETIVAQRRIFDALPQEARKSTTLDNGRENHLHYELKELGMDTYHADPYSSWQRGTNEHHNGVLRRYVPKGTNLDTIDDDELQGIVREINGRPRKCLGWRTPKEVFEELIAGVRIQD